MAPVRRARLVEEITSDDCVDIVGGSDSRVFKMLKNITINVSKLHILRRFSEIRLDTHAIQNNT